MDEKKEWKGVMVGYINIFDEPREAPGWECPECGYRIGMIDYPFFPCPKCGFKPKEG